MISSHRPRTFVPQVVIPQCRGGVRAPVTQEVFDEKVQALAHKKYEKRLELHQPDDQDSDYYSALEEISSTYHVSSS